MILIANIFPLSINVSVWKIWAILKVNKFNNLCTENCLIVLPNYSIAYDQMAAVISPHWLNFFTDRWSLEKRANKNSVSWLPLLFNVILGTV